MNKNEKNRVPELRFPEFEKGAEWNLSALSESLAYEQPTEYLVQSTNYKDQYPTPVLTAGKTFVLGYTNEKEGVFKNPLPVIIFDDFTTATQFVDFPFKTKSSAMKILKQRGRSNIKFVYESMQNINFAVGVHKRHWISVYSNLKIPIPEPDEQQKVAVCLSSLDELIAAEQDRLAALKLHKKGLLQNLFPKEGEKVPANRFPEFRSDGVWSLTKVLDNCVLKGRIGYRGYTKNDLVKIGKGALVLGGKHITDHKLDISDPTYVTWEKYYESPEIMVELDHIIFSQRGSLGDCAIIDEEIGPATINPSMVLLKDISCIPKFLYYSLIGDRIQKKVANQSSSSAVPMLSQRQINDFSFFKPNKAEQEKIVRCLSTIDYVILTQKGKIENLENHKAGLLQGLFPKI